MKPSLLITASILAGLLLAFIWIWQSPREAPSDDRVLPLAARPTGGDFRLESVQGPIDLAAFRGQVVVIYFGYTWCPDICPTNLAHIAQSLEALAPDERERVQVLFISVDPQRDTVERLDEYLAFFDASLVGLTGSEAEIAKVASLYGAAFQRQEKSDSTMGYTVDHSANTYLVDLEGRLARTLGHATPPQDMAAAIRSLLTPANQR